MPGTLEDYAAAVNEVLSVCRDAEQAFRGAANAARAAALAETLVQYSEQYGRFESDIQSALKSMGFDPTYPLGVAGLVHAGWINVKALVDGHDEHGIWVEAGHIVDRSMQAYLEAIEKTLPVGIRALLEKEYEEIQTLSAQVTARSNSTAPPDPPAAEPNMTKPNTPK